MSIDNCETEMCDLIINVEEQEDLAPGIDGQLTFDFILVYTTDAGTEITTD